MFRSLFLIGTTGFWITMMSFMIQRELFQLAPLQTPYEILPLHDSPLRDEYQAIYMGDKRIGFTQEVLQAGEGPEDPPFKLKHSTYLSFLLLGHENEMIVRGEADLDEKLYLKAFAFKITNKGYVTKISGNIQNQLMTLLIEDEDNAPTQKTVPMTGLILHSESIPYLWTPKNLVIGKTGRLQVWNPLVLSVEDIHFKISHKEMIQYDNQEMETFVITLKKGDLQTHAWVTPEGTLLRMETPAGLLMEKEPGWKIFDGMREQRSSPPDLPNLYSVAANVTIPNPESLVSIKLKVTTPQGENILKLSAADFEPSKKITLPIKMDQDWLPPYLESSEFIQSDDPEIKKVAADIVGNETNALTAALRIMHWVHNHMTPTPTASLPSARQVLAQKMGDCNEYTVLFTALARAAGIPTKMLAGLVYQNGRFFYHAWAAVYIGQWIALDPTFNQEEVDVTHIPLVEGDLKDQVALVSQLGNIKVSILEMTEK